MEIYGESLTEKQSSKLTPNPVNAKLNSHLNLNRTNVKINLGFLITPSETLSSTCLKLVTY